CPAARSSSPPAAGWPGTEAGRSPGRTRPRSTAAAPTRCGGWPRTSSRPASPTAARRRSRMRSGRPSRSGCSWSASSPNMRPRSGSRTPCWRSSTCGRPRSSGTWTCCGPSTLRRRHSGISAGRSPTFPGSGPTARARCGRRPASETRGPAGSALGSVRCSAGTGPAAVRAAACRWTPALHAATAASPCDDPGPTALVGQERGRANGPRGLAPPPPPPRPQCPAPRPRAETPPAAPARGGGAASARGGGAASARGGKRPGPPAQQLPVAKIAVDVPLVHLDRPFDYLVPKRQAATAVPGCRVRVRFAGQPTSGYLLERAAAPEHRGRLAYLDRFVPPDPVRPPETAAPAREVADRCAGTLADVPRLAIPPRHAGAEAADRPPQGAWDGGRHRPGSHDGQLPSLPRPEPGPWARYPAGQAFLAALSRGRAPRAVWSALPRPHWPDQIATAAAAAASAGRGTVIVVPDARDLALVDRALSSALGPDRHVCLRAGLRPARRQLRLP